MLLRTPRRPRRRAALVVAALLASLLGATAPAAHGLVAPVRIMALGDSITAGSGFPNAFIGGYRVALEDYLQGGGYEFDFVGSQANTGATPLADVDHEGHGGFRIQGLTDSVASWLGSANPDVVLLMAGTNDMYDTDYATAPTRLGTLLDTILATKPNAKVIVSTIPVMTDEPTPGRVAGYNSAVPGVVAARGSRVSLVDASSLTTGDLVDQRHPNRVGYRKLAKIWFNGLKTVLPSPTKSGTLYLSDALEYEISPNASANGLGPLERDLANGGAGAAVGGALTLKGVTYTKGLGTFAPANIYYDLNGQFSQFDVTVGVDDSAPAGTSSFVVFLDGAIVYNTGARQAGNDPIVISLPVTGKSTLRLQQTLAVAPAVPGDWVNARLTYAPAGTAGGEFHALTPTRIYDSRSSSPVGPASVRNVTVSGQGGVPASGVSAVALNVTVDRATAPSFLSVFPRDDSGATPTTSNLNFVAGRATPALVITTLGLGGQVSLYNSAGSTDVIVDVLGWFGDNGTRYHSETPSRCFDTRSTTATKQPINGGEAIAVSFTGGVSASAAHKTAVMLNVTAANPTTNGYLTVFPIDIAQPVSASLPNSSNVNFFVGQGAVANAAIAKVRDSNGYVGFYNSSGKTDIICDSFGYFDDGTIAAGAGQTLRVLNKPVRVLDTRTGLAPVGSASANKLTLTAGESRTILIAGDPRSGVPSSGVTAAAVNITVDRPGTGGFISAFPGNVAVADGQKTSVLNFASGQSIPNFAIVPLGNGQITLYNGSPGVVDLLVDVFAYFVS